MQKERMIKSNIKQYINTLVVGIVFGLVANPALGDMTFTIQQDGDDVFMAASGSVNLNALSKASQSVPYSIIRADSMLLGVGDVGPNLQHYTGLSGPGLIGSGTGYSLATTTSGDNFMVSYYAVSVPLDYVSGSALSGTATFSNKTIAGLGLTEGTYVYNWGSDADADSVTVHVGAVPEPASLGLIAIFGGGVFAVRRIFMI